MHHGGPILARPAGGWMSDWVPGGPTEVSSQFVYRGLVESEVALPKAFEMWQLKPGVMPSGFP